MNEIKTDKEHAPEDVIPQMTIVTPESVGVLLWLSLKGNSGNASTEFCHEWSQEINDYRSYLFDKFIESLDNPTVLQSYLYLLKAIAYIEWWEWIILDHLMDVADEIQTDSIHLLRYLQVCQAVSQIQTDTIHLWNILYQHLSGICSDFSSDQINEEREVYLRSRLAWWNLEQRTLDFLAKYPWYLPEGAQVYIEQEYDFYAGVSLYLRNLMELIRNSQNSNLVSHNDISMMESLVYDMRGMVDSEGVYIALAQDELDWYFTTIKH